MGNINYRAWLEDEKRYMYCDVSKGDRLETFNFVVKQLENLTGKEIKIEEY